MGGSGGGHSGPSIPMEELYARSQSRTEQRQYELEVEDLLTENLGNFNDRDVEVINDHLATIEEALSKDSEEIVKLAFGGSVIKHTYVDGLSDVDILVCLNDTSLENKNPNQVLKYFEAMLHERLPNTEISRGDLAITVKFSDGNEIQLLPAIETATGCRIAQPKQNQWSNVIHPESFAKKLTQVNQSNGGKVVPVIKLLKPMNERLPEALRLSGYHIESLAIRIFENYNGRATFREMVKHFWYKAQSEVLNPVLDTTGQSRHVDDYLGRAGSDARHQVSKAIGRVITKIERADNLKSTDRWQELLEI